jgi:hypothetical protein
VNDRPPAVLYRFSATFFVAFLALAVWAFWPSYFARLFEQPNVWFHAHGIVLTLWLVMLAVQAQLIRTQRRSWHRALGKSSYAVAPALVVITTIFIHQRISQGAAGVPSLPPVVLYFLALTLLSLVAFALFYFFAMRARRDSQTHARWMVCTVFPLFTPVTDRLIGAHLPALAGMVPRIEGTPILPTVGFAAADLIVLALAAWDWRSNRRLDVFPVALGVLLLYHVGTLTLHRVPLWGAFCEWFLSLPLS